MSASIQNPEAAQNAQTELLKQVRPGIEPRAAEFAETREHVETAADPEQLTLEVRGESIPCDPIGLGARLRPSKMQTTAEERGDDVMMAEAILRMIDILNDASADEYGLDFWDDLIDTELRDAFRELSEKSAGGNA